MTIEELISGYINDQRLARFKHEIDFDRIVGKRRKTSRQLDNGNAHRMIKFFSKLEPFQTSYYDFKGSSVSIGREEELSDNQQQALLETLKALCPWRKGPYNYFGTKINAEWDSSLKWNRVMTNINPVFKNKVVADIGCNNSYYMYRMLAHNPLCVIGFEPMERYYFHFLLNQNYVNARSLHFEIMGVDDLHLFKNFFDIVFFMGIIYHRRNPITSLEILADAMKPGGQLIFETIVIPGDGETCLIPGKTYMKARGYWFLPTIKACQVMLERTGFTSIKLHDHTKTTLNEQRRTAWADTESLESFLDMNNPEKTIEGYPAPYRVLISAIKKNKKVLATKAD